MGDMITKERIQSEFARNKIPLNKLRFVGDGWIVYHPYGMEYQQKRYKRTLVAEEGNKKTYCREKRTVILNKSFIDSESMLEIAIAEAKIRGGV